MANEVYTRTNQALQFARWALQSWQAAVDDQALDALTRQRYHREHVLLHLQRTLLGLLHEVGERYRWPLLEVRIPEQVLVVSNLERYPCAELGELIELAGRPDSWLSLMLSAWQQLSAAPREVADSSSQLLASTAVSASWETAAAEQCIAGLSDCINRFRSGMQEW